MDEELKAALRELQWKGGLIKLALLIRAHHTAERLGEAWLVAGPAERRSECEKVLAQFASSNPDPKGEADFLIESEGGITSGILMVLAITRDTWAPLDLSESAHIKDILLAQSPKDIQLCEERRRIEMAEVLSAMRFGDAGNRYVEIILRENNLSYTAGMIAGLLVRAARLLAVIENDRIYAGCSTEAAENIRTRLYGVNPKAFRDAISKIADGLHAVDARTIAVSIERTVGQTVASY